MNETNERGNLKPAVGYCRYSTSSQREESIFAQKRAIGSYCFLNGYEIVEWYCDEGVSGRGKCIGRGCKRDFHDTVYLCAWICQLIGKQ